MRFSLIPRSIGGLAISIAAVTGLVTLSLAVAAIQFFHRELERQLDQRIETETHALLDYYADNGFEALARVVANRDRRSLPGEIGYLAAVDEQDRAIAYVLLDAQGRRRAGSFRPRAAIPPGWSEFVRFRTRDGRVGVAQAVNSTLSGGGQLVVAADRSIIRQMHHSMLKMFAVGYGVLLVFGTLAMLGFARAVRRRLGGIESSAEAIMAGDWSRRMPLDGSRSEFDRLSLVLNRMLDRIAALVDNLRQVSGDIAHDLRTPLQRVRGRLEAIADADDAAAHRPALEKAIRETDDLLELFSSLLAISEIEGRSVRSRFGAVDLARTITEIVEVYRPSVEDGNRTLLLRTTPVSTWGDANLLQRIVANLLDNALIHTPVGTTIEVSLERSHDEAILTVRDDGPGIPESEHVSVFRRLTRLDTSRSTPGHGLGLNLVAAIAEAHGGTVAIVPSATGLVVRIALPLTSPGQ